MQYKHSFSIWLSSVLHLEAFANRAFWFEVFEIGIKPGPIDLGLGKLHLLDWLFGDELLLKPLDINLTVLEPKGWLDLVGGQLLEVDSGKKLVGLDLIGSLFVPQPLRWLDPEERPEEGLRFFGEVVRDGNLLGCNILQYLVLVFAEEWRPAREHVIED